MQGSTKKVDRYVGGKEGRKACHGERPSDDSKGSERQKTTEEVL